LTAWCWLEPNTPDADANDDDDHAAAAAIAAPFQDDAPRKRGLPIGVTLADDPEEEEC